MTPFGQIVLPTAVEDDIIDHFKLWMPTYLREMDRVTGRADSGRKLPPVKTWGLNDPDLALGEQLVTPAIFVETASVTPVGKSSSYGGVHDITVAAITRSEHSIGQSRELAVIYCVAAVMILIQQPMPRLSVSWGEQLTQEPLRASARRYLSRAETQITVESPLIFERDAGPVEPAPLPEAPPADYATAQTVEVAAEDTAVSVTEADVDGA